MKTGADGVHEKSEAGCVLNRRVKTGIIQISFVTARMTALADCF
ncbi:hypothetical protein ANACOL_03815 [Anaerotruncus colihominis DSM 17241]|uniref:Uncharacterized protein n=1 Tax=Anaerotruncus colihominis DSM 17241 TaxID=445972 RepID=B0PG83_9FIRM|nr:hypothetical protein ANACOL_03815 [Anaerotruncus colihominis DSM 17241]